MKIGSGSFFIKKETAGAGPRGFDFGKSLERRVLGHELLVPRFTAIGDPCLDISPGYFYVHFPEVASPGDDSPAMRWWQQRGLSHSDIVSFVAYLPYLSKLVGSLACARELVKFFCLAKAFFYDVILVYERQEKTKINNH